MGVAAWCGTGSGPAGTVVGCGRSASSMSSMSACVTTPAAGSSDAATSARLCRSLVSLCGSTVSSCVSGCVVVLGSRRCMRRARRLLCIFVGLCWWWAWLLADWVSLPGLRGWCCSVCWNVLERYAVWGCVVVNAVVGEVSGRLCKVWDA